MRRRTAWAIGVLGLCGAAASVLACSDDDNGGSPLDSGPEGAVVETGSPMHDASSVDATTEGGAPDAGGDGAASPEGSTGDASSGSDASDASDAMACTVIEASLDEASVQAGMSLVMQYKCSNCHGSGLTGNTTSVVDGGQVYPPNLTADPATGLGCWTQAQVARAVLDGIDNDNMTLCVMPHFRGKFVEAGIDPDAAANQITQFLLAAPPVNHTVPDTVCPAAADAGGD